MVVKASGGNTPKILTRQFTIVAGDTFKLFTYDASFLNGTGGAPVAGTDFTVDGGGFWKTVGKGAGNDWDWNKS